LKNETKKLTYKSAGVDTAEGQRAVELMKEHVTKTLNGNVLFSQSSFGGLFDISGSGIDDPVLVSGTDGVGTKLKLAFALGRHDTIGIDAVAMCVNDILCHGARPLFFLDYIATGKVEAEKVAEIVCGVAAGCEEAGCALIGGETAEMPGFYADGEYDIAGFAVGIVSKKKMIDGSKIRAGDRIIGIPSSGVHSNGFSLVRKVLPPSPELLTPTKIYAKQILPLIEKYDIHALVHITGGGFYENVPRVVPDGLTAEIDARAWTPPEIFAKIQQAGNIDDKAMFETFNMGLGMLIFAGEDEAENILADLTTGTGSLAQAAQTTGTGLLAQETTGTETTGTGSLAQAAQTMGATTGTGSAASCGSPCEIRRATGTGLAAQVVGKVLHEDSGSRFRLRF
jgi:phosphoribosylformylglycinamidine cyclo-ligase